MTSPDMPVGVPRSTGCTISVDRLTGDLHSPGEIRFGYVQAVGSGRHILVSGQAAVSASGNDKYPGDLPTQVRQSYANVLAVLRNFGATLNDVVDETIYLVVTQEAEAVAVPRGEAYGGRARVSCTLTYVPKLAHPDALVEIQCIARKPSMFAQLRRRKHGRVEVRGNGGS